MTDQEKMAQDQKDQVAKEQEQKVADRKVELAKEQDKVQALAEVAKSGKSNYEQQEEFGRHFEEKEGEDSFRRAARFERERDAAMFSGDPTRDPVAKQAAMDRNTVLPGAAEDAKKIKDVGAEKLKQDTEAHNFGGPVSPTNVK